MPSSIGLDVPTMETYNGHVKTPQDAIILFEACRIGLLPRVQRRLSEKERQAIKSGSVFVWDEREAGMRRWTDGKSWSASRVNGSFLTYREMEGKRTMGSTGGGGGHSPKDGADGDSNGGDGPDGYRYKPDGLTKQSFSITTSQGQHLHLISYFSRSHVSSGQLQQPTVDPQLRHVRPERGMYPESTLTDHTNTPAMTRSPMTNMNPRYAMDGSPQHTITAASTPQYAQPRHYDPYRNRDPYAQAYNWPPSPMHTPPIGSAPVGSHQYSPRYASGGSLPGSTQFQHSPLTYSAQSAHALYPPYHHREISNTTAFDRLPPAPMANGAGLPPPPPPPPHAPPYAPTGYPPPPNSYPPPPTSAPSGPYYSPVPPPPTSYPSSHPIAYIPSSGPTPPESNTLPPFRRGPSPLRDSASPKQPQLAPHRSTPPTNSLPAISETHKESPHPSEQKKGMIPSINALINQTPPPDTQSQPHASAHTPNHAPIKRDRLSPPTPAPQPGFVSTATQAQPSFVSSATQAQQSPYQPAALRPNPGSRSGSRHGSEHSSGNGEQATSGANTGNGRSRCLDDTNALRRLDGAFAASR